MERVLDVAASLDAERADDVECARAEHLVVLVGEGLARGHDDGVSGMHADGVEVFHVADDDAVSGAVSDHFIFYFLPSRNAFFDEYLSDAGKREAVRGDLLELALVHRDAAARIALGYTLDEIKNSVTGKTYAAFEPALDYCVVKIPRWPFDKFVNAKRKLGTQMQATGEVMAISYSFEGALMKAVRSLEQNVYSLWHRKFAALSTEDLMNKITLKVSDERLFEISELMRRGTTTKVIHDITKIDYWFLDRIMHILDIEKRMSFGAKDYDTLMEAKICGFPDREIARLLNVDEKEIKYLRKRLDILPAYNMVDTCAGFSITPRGFSATIRLD